MKKTRFITFVSLLIALLLAFSAGCTGCNPNKDNGDGHTHSYSAEYKSDDTNHWLECSCGDKKEVAAHVYTDGKCACGHETYVPENQEEQDFLDDIGGVSETFTGAVSKETFESAEVAAEAFIAEEVAGEKEAKIVNTVSKGTLTESQINDLDLSAEDKNGIVSIEEVEIEYSLTDGGDAPFAAAPSNTRKIKVYIIKYENVFKYITPAPKTGDTITKSYYDSIFDTEKYKNCTLTMTATMGTSMVVAGGTESGSTSTTRNVTQTIKHADGKILMSVTSSGTVDYNGEKSTVTSSFDLYVEEVDGTISCYAKMDGSAWMQTDLEIIGFSSIEELQPFYDDFLDYTYFEKTAYGCTISSENFERYVMQALGELLEDVPAGQVPTLDFDGHAKFFVSNGVLSGELVELTAGYSQSINQAGLAMSISMSISETAKVTCTDYGSTVIERPNVG